MNILWLIGLATSLILSIFFIYNGIVGMNMRGGPGLGGIMFVAEIFFGLFLFFMSFFGAWVTYFSPRVKKILNNNKFEHIIKILAVSLVLLIMGIIFFSLSLS